MSLCDLENGSILLRWKIELLILQASCRLSLTSKADLSSVLDK